MFSNSTLATTSWSRSPRSTWARRSLRPGHVHDHAALPAKHKLALVDLKPGDTVYLYGMVVGEAVEPIPRGGLF